MEMRKLNHLATLVSWMQKYHRISTYVTLLVIPSLYMEQLDNLLADRDI